MSEPVALVLEIFKQDDSLKVGLFDQGQNIPTLRHYNKVSVCFEELRQLSLELVEILNRQAHDQVSRSGQLKSLEKTGYLLWNHLLSRPIKERLKNCQSCDLTICLDEELIHIPWELIFDGEKFLCLKFSLGRLVRSQGDSSAIQYRSLSDNLKMLILANPNNDLKSAYTEGIYIKNQFKHKANKTQIDFKSTNIDKSYVKKNICDYDIVHFAGHAEFDKKIPHNSGWILSDGILKVEDILKMASNPSLPALVFSNACNSAQINTASIDSEYQKNSYGMASAFLFSGVRHYIGTIRKIEDNASLVFAREFYAKLISGATVGESLRLSKLKLVKEFGIASLHWVNYLLYGDPGFTLFRIFRHRSRTNKIAAFYKKFRLRIYLSIIFLTISFSSIVLIPKINPGKFYLFFNSQAAYRNGDNQAAISLGERLINKDANFLGVYPIIADAYERLGEKEKAIKYYYEYVLRSERMDKKNHLGQAYIKLGWSYHTAGQFDKAKQLYEKALVLSKKEKNRQNEALALRKIAVWNIEKNNYEQALDLLTKSVAINQEYPKNPESLKNLASDYFDIGLVYANKEDYPAARDFYLKSQKLFEKLNLINELSDCYFNLGEIFLYEKQFQKASDYYFKGLKIDKDQNNKINLVSDYNMIGELYLEMEDLVKAEEYFKQSFSLAEEINSQLDLADASYNLGVVYKRQGRKNLARQYWRKAQEILREIEPLRYQKIRTQLIELDSL